MKSVHVACWGAILGAIAGGAAEVVVPAGLAMWSPMIGGSVGALFAYAVVLCWGTVSGSGRGSAEMPLRDDVIDRDLNVVWTKNERGYPIGATSIDDMVKEGKLAPPPASPPPGEN